ncbi:hypothetical protein FHS96_004649 [Sphingomonas zeicaulis]|uniref:hypothetical protein n=1 Tax=Sphingomonas zeicaulis TaxID=1632740 RepID=UPI003D23281A
MRWTGVTRLVLCFLLAPIPLIPVGLYAVLWLTTAMGGNEDPIELLPMVSAAIYLYAGLFGLPLYLTLRWIGRQGFIHYVLAGLVLSLILAIGSLFGGQGLVGFFFSFIFWAVLILVPIILFWLIALWQPRWPRRLRPARAPRPAMR